MQSTELVNRYFASVRARDIDAFMALFAEDATFVTPDGREFVGADAIRTMETGVFEAVSAPTPRPTNIIVGQGAIAVEVDVLLTNGRRLQMGSFYQLDQAGLIQRLIIYRQGAQITAV